MARFQHRSLLPSFSFFFPLGESLKSNRGSKQRRPDQRNCLGFVRWMHLREEPWKRGRILIPLSRFSPFTPLLQPGLIRFFFLTVCEISRTDDRVSDVQGCLESSETADRSDGGPPPVFRWLTDNCCFSVATAAATAGSDPSPDPAISG